MAAGVQQINTNSQQSHVDRDSLGIHQRYQLRLKHCNSQPGHVRLASCA